MMHPLQPVSGYFDEEMQTTSGVWGRQLMSTEFCETDVTRGSVRGAKRGLLGGGQAVRVHCGHARAGSRLGCHDESPVRTAEALHSRPARHPRVSLHQIAQTSAQFS
jgi:hypothetical protein